MENGSLMTPFIFRHFIKNAVSEILQQCDLPQSKGSVGQSCYDFSLWIPLQM